MGLGTMVEVALRVRVGEKDGDSEKLVKDEEVNRSLKLMV